MEPVFYYSHKQRTSAKRILLNMLLLPLMYGALWQFNDGSDAYAQLLDVGFYALLATEVVLTLLAVYFWRNDKAFVIELTAKTLSVSDPMFGDYSWQVNVADIAEIQHDIGVQTLHTRILLFTKDGEKYQLSMNYAYSRSGLYEAIGKLNPRVKIPDNPYRFNRKT